MTKITYEFDSDADAFDLSLFQHGNKLYFSLDEIYNLVRNELKHGNEELSDHIEQLLEKIREKAAIVHEMEE